MGRVEHQLVGEQAGADLGRVELAKKRYQHHYIEMEPGDVLFFHCNLLHTSDQNKSDMRRWAMITSYNQVTQLCLLGVKLCINKPNNFLSSIKFFPQFSLN